MDVLSGFGAQGPCGSGQLLERENPARFHEVVSHVHATTSAEVAEVVAGAVAAQREWARVPLERRVATLLRAADAVESVAHTVGALLCAELGKPIGDAEGECRFAAAWARHVATRAVSLLGSVRTDDERGRREVHRDPFGVIAAVVPWNAPLILASLKVAPAVVAGNAIVVKPAPIVPAAVTLALQAWAAEFPPGLISVVHGGAEVGDALIGDPRIAKVAFTGGTEVGRVIAQRAGQRLVPSIMELGGNDAALVLEDCEFTPAMMSRLVFGALLTQGQVCMAAKRVYVPRERLQDFTDAFIESARSSLVCGDPSDPAVTFGPLVSAAHRTRLHQLASGDHGADARSVELGSLGTGWDPERGYFMRPVLVSNADAHCELVVDEQFGPVLPVVAYDTCDQAVDWVNDSPYGLASSVWSESEDAAFEVARRIDASSTFINCHNRAGMALDLPFGGRRLSGFGREFGDEGIVSYTQSHAINLPGTARGDVAGNHSGRHYPS